MERNFGSFLKSDSIYRFTPRLAKAIFAFVLSVSLVNPLITTSAALAINSAQTGSELVPLRNAVKSGQIKLKVNGDGVNTAQVSLQLTNTTDKPIKIVIPANEVLKPNSPLVQTMLLTVDKVLIVQPGQTAITTISTVCASPKTVPPPPPVQEGLNFEVTDYSDPSMWSKLAQIVAAGKELEQVGAFGNLLFPSQRAIKALIDAEIANRFENKIKMLMEANPELSRKDAEEIVNKDMARLREQAKAIVFKREKQKRTEQITQLAIWKVIGLASGDKKNIVDPEAIEKDILKELSEQIKKDKTLLAALGGKINRKGEFIPNKAQKKALAQKTELIFDVVNLTVNRSKESGLQGVATLPNNDSCSTFCSVGERAYKEGNYPEAQELLTAAVDEAEEFGEADPRLSRSLNSLAMCFLDMTSYGKAEKLFLRALGLREKVFGPQSKEAGEVNNNLGLTNQQQERFLAAEKFFKKAISIFGSTTGRTSNEIAESLNNLGKNHTLLDQAEEAKTPLAKALSVGIINSPKDLKGNQLFTPFVADVETNLADVYVKLGKYARAAVLYQKALATDKKQLGDYHPFIAKILDGLATVTSKLGEVADAEIFKKQAQHIREKTLGKDNHEIAMLPLGSAAFTRIWNFVEGKKEIQANVASLKAAANAIRGDSKKVINRPIKDKWALVVGISEFKDSSINLKYAAKDASDFAKFLVEEANFAPDHVRLLTNKKATREEIMAQLGDKWLPRVAGPDDLVLIFFSSHGSPTQMDVNSVNYLIAHNTDKNSLYATGIALQEFAQTIKKRVHSERVVLLMDACHSGAAVGAKGIFRNFGVDANKVAQGTGQMVICSSGSNQTSWESKRHPNGVFTYHLLEGLRKDPKLGKVFQYMKNKVQQEVQMDRNGEVQTPVLQSKWEGNDLVIGVPPSDPRAGIPWKEETDNTKASAR